MLKFVLSKCRLRKSIFLIAAMSLIISIFGAFVFSPTAATNQVIAANAVVPINMIYYGWHDATVDNSIVNAHPEFLVDNSSAGPWKGNASISKFTSAGIKYFEYIDGGYEGTASQAIPNDLQSNLSYINAAATAGAYGVFLDEVSSNPSTSSLNYLKQIADKAHSLGLKVVFNAGVDSWSDSLMTYCDFMNSSEIWNNASLTASQSKWASRTWLLSQNVTSATTAANLTNAAISKGIGAHYACTSYGALPTWLGTYVANISSSAPAPTPTPTPTSPTPTGKTSVTFNSNPNGSEVWLDYAYKGVTPMNLTVSTGNHHIGFNKYGYHNNTPLEGNFLLGNTAMIVNGDLLSGQITFTGTASPAPTPTPTPTPTSIPAPVSGNTVGTVANTPVASGGANEYNFYLKITSTTVSGVTVGKQVWCAASTTDFPNLLTRGTTLTGNLDHSLGWWVIKR